MKKLLPLALFLLSLSSFAQSGGVRGVVYEKENGAPVSFASVYLKETLQGSITDENGFFNIGEVKPGTYTLFCSYVGFDSVSVKVQIEESVIVRNLYLKESSKMLNEVNISAARQEKKTSTQIGKTKITPKDMQKLVTLGGEPDLIQSLQILPGVSTSGDQGGQLYVRGGSPVMNKVLLDGMTIYQPFHSIGLFSVFDADIIRSADVYSAGFGAQFGGRISAIIDVNTREGNKTRLAGKVAVNPFTSKVLLEGPLKKYKEGSGSTSFILSYKNSFLDRSAPIFYSYLDENRLPYSFHDLYGKISVVGSNGSKIDFFGYNHLDRANFMGVTEYKWNSAGFGSRFVVLPDESQTKIDGFFSYSTYDVSQQEGNADPRTSDISSFNIGLNFDYLMGQNKFVYGTEITSFRTNYEFTNPAGRGVGDFDNNTELSLYGDFKYVTNRWVLEPGVRIQYYASISTPSLEPRVAVKYKATSKLRFKAAAGIYSQNLISAVSDRDVVNLFYGFLTGPDNLPQQFRGEEVNANFLQKAWHAVGGIEWDLSKNLDLLVEGYYKDYYQLSNINRNKLFEDNRANADVPEIYRLDYIVEDGKAYGLDTRLKYEYKGLYLWAVYSLTFVTRRDELQEYAPHFDRRHNINLVGSYAFGKDKSWEVNARWNMGSGFPFTPTVAFFEQLTFNDNNSGGGPQSTLGQDYTRANGEIGVLYGDLNSRRLPYFHRLDVSVQKKFKFGKFTELNVVAGCINVYNRANIFYFNLNTYDRVNQLPIMPTLGLNLSF